MNNYRYARGATIAAAAMLLSLGALPVQAQAPGGSYLETCTNVRSIGDRVIADCRRVDGGWTRTVLRDADSCVGGIANMNGQLTCNHARRGYGEMRGRGWGEGYGSSRDLGPDRYRDYRDYRDYNGR
jgi:hypothetical protein